MSREEKRERETRGKREDRWWEKKEGRAETEMAEEERRKCGEIRRGTREGERGKGRDGWV